jgi:hypothetical protein
MDFKAKPWYCGYNPEKGTDEEVSLKSINEN